MIAATSHRLRGLEPDNLLAFLALLGLLRALQAADETLCPRAAWDVDTPPLRPRLFLARALTEEELTERTAKGIDEIAESHDFGGRKDLKSFPRRVSRALEPNIGRLQRRQAGACRSPGGADERRRHQG